MSPEHEALCRNLVGGLVNGVFQGCLLTLIVGAALAASRRLNAATRHAVLLVTLGCVAILPLAHCLRDAEPDARGRSDGRAAAAGGLDIALTRSSSPQADEPQGRDEGDGLAEEEAAVLRQENPAPAAGVAEALPKAVLGAEVLRGWESIFPTTAPVFTRLPLPGSAAAALLVLWLLGAGALALRLGWQFRLLRELKRQGHAPDAATTDLFAQLRRTLVMRRRPRLLLSELAPAPLAVGFRHPAVVLPADLIGRTSGDELGQILRHEMAHLVRGDDWANLFQQALKAAYFFHPAVWYLSKRLTVEREIACDDRVIERLPNPRTYALLLAEFAGRQNGRPLAAATAAWGNQSQLKERIHMLLDSQRNASPGLARGRFATLIAGALALSFAGLRAAPRVALAPAAAPSGAEVVADDEAGSKLVIHTSVAPEVTVSDDVRVQLSTATVTAPDVTSTVAVVTSPAAESADSEPESGPVPKPSAVPAPPAPPAPAARPFIASVSAVAAAPEAPAGPDQAREGKPGADVWSDRSIERRLDRLERLVRQILEREKKPTLVVKADDHAMKGPHEAEMETVQHQMEKAQKQVEEAQRQIERQAEEMARRAEQAAARAERDIERKAAEMERRQAEAERRAEARSAPTPAPGLGGEVEALRQERQALRAERKALEQRLHELEKQLGKLDRGPAKDGKQGEQDNANQDQDAPTPKPPKPSAAN